MPDSLVRDDVVVILLRLTLSWTSLAMVAVMVAGSHLPKHTGSRAQAVIYRTACSVSPPAWLATGLTAC